jgi:putative membrane protein
MVGCADRDRTTPSDAVGTAGETAGTVSRADQDFVRDFAIIGMAEIELGKMAASRGMNPEVKRFGERMVADHTKGSEKLKSVASRHNISMPTELDSTHRELRDKLAALQGSEFDREYMSAMVSGHGDAVDKLESRLDSAKLAEWKAKVADKMGGTPQPTEPAGATGMVPEKSDNPVTMSINEWAAAAHPTTYGHLQAAKSLNDSLKKRTTN